MAHADPPLLPVRADEPSLPVRAGESMDSPDCPVDSQVVDCPVDTEAELVAIIASAAEVPMDSPDPVDTAEAELIARWSRLACIGRDVDVFEVWPIGAFFQSVKRVLPSSPSSP